MRILNKKARFNYTIIDSYTAGIMLLGSEVKSILEKNITFADSHVIIRNGELFVVGLNIARYKEAGNTNHEEGRIRKLLLNRKEIDRIEKNMDENGVSVIPLEMTIINGKIKMIIGIGKGKKSADKRETIKKRDIERELQRKF